MKITNGSVDGIVLLSEAKEICNTTIVMNNFLVERVQISKDKTDKDLKKECITSFTNLINKLLLKDSF